MFLGSSALRDATDDLDPVERASARIIDLGCGQLDPRAVSELVNGTFLCAAGVQVPCPVGRSVWDRAGGRLHRKAGFESVAGSCFGRSACAGLEISPETIEPPKANKNKVF
jgi:hypothetical protein